MQLNFLEPKGDTIISVINIYNLQRVSHLNLLRRDLFDRDGDDVLYGLSSSVCPMICYLTISIKSLTLLKSL